MPNIHGIAVSAGPDIWLRAMETSWSNVAWEGYYLLHCILTFCSFFACVVYRPTCKIAVNHIV